MGIYNMLMQLKILQFRFNILKSGRVYNIVIMSLFRILIWNFNWVPWLIMQLPKTRKGLNSAKHTACYTHISTLHSTLILSILISAFSILHGKCLLILSNQPVNVV